MAGEVNPVRRVDGFAVAGMECDHTGPVMVAAAEGGHRARCLSCGFVGPVREDSDSAWYGILPPEAPDARRRA